MTSIFADDALHLGRDANDSSWHVLRDAHDWHGATLRDVMLDSRPALALVPTAVDGEDLQAEVCGSDGTCYRVEPGRDRVSVRRACDTSWSLLIGGRGHEAGRLHRPIALALDERRRLLAIAEAANHRVQIVRADTGEPVITLGAVDAWGRGIARGHDRALAEPVALAFDRGMLAIADRAGGRIHLYDDGFRWLRSFAPVPERALKPAPTALALVGCVVWVIDRGWSVPVAYDLDGDLVVTPGVPPDALASWKSRARYAARGEVIAKPIDSGEDGFAWHRIIVDAHTPAGTRIEIQTFASDTATAPPVIAWAPARPVPIPLAAVDPTDGVSDRPVMPDHGRWERERAAPYVRRNRSLGALAGSGPVNVAGFAAPWQIARQLRRGDVVRLESSGATSVPVPIAAIAGRSVRALVRGDLQAYGVATRVTLVERDNATPLGGPRVIATLAAGETLDLSAAADDETLHDLASSHGVAALLRDGDVVTLESGANRATLVIHTIDISEATVSLAAAVSGDFSVADVMLVTTTDRLVVENLAWSENVPAGEPLIVRDDVASIEVHAEILWVDVDLGVIWLEPGAPVPWETWTGLTVATPVTTDRGRYLWVRLRLFGALAQPGDEHAISTPVIRAVRVLRARPSYLRYLPAVYSRRDADDPTGALFLERLLALPERKLTAVETVFESIARQLNPLASSEEWLAFIASWYGLVFDPSWPIDRRRLLLISAHELFAKRGTLDGMRRYLEIYTGSSPSIIEAFQYRVGPSRSLGNPDVVLGRTALNVDATPDAQIAHRFSIWVYGDRVACDAALIEKAARAIVDAVKPAHTIYELFVVDGPPRVGISSMVGVDTVLIGGERPPAPLGLAPQPPLVLGRTHLPVSPRAASSPTLGPIPIDPDLTLT